MSKHTPEPWRACHDGKCQCKMIWSIPGDYPVATVNAGPTGDEYPEIREGKDGKPEAYMEMIEYWDINEETAVANVARIVACVNACASFPDPSVVEKLVEALRWAYQALDKEYYSVLAEKINAVLKEIDHA